MRRLTMLGIVLALFIMPAITQAQWSVGPQIVISIPTSDFANVSDVGGGFGIKVIRQLNSLGGVALRGDFAFLSHGKDFQTVETFSGSFAAEVRHESFRINFGSQYSFGTDNFKLYLGARGGFYFFRTNINIPTSFGFLTAEDESDAAVGWNVGGGIQYDIGLGPFLDLAIEYQTIYNITTELEIQDDAGGVVTAKQDITANEFTVKIGVTFFLGK